MFGKLGKKNKFFLYLTLAAIINLALVNTAMPALFDCIYDTQKACSLLRAVSFKNGNGKLPTVSSATPTANENSRGEPMPGAVTTVLVTEGVITAASKDGQEILVPAGTRLIVESGQLKPLTRQQRDVVPVEYRGTPLDEVKAQFTVSQDIALGRSKSFSRLADNKVIEYNVDMLPAPTADTDSENIVKGILETIARRMLYYRKDARFSGRLYVGFISRQGNAIKQQNIVALFKGLDIVKDYNLDNMLADKAGAVKGTNRLTITHLGDEKPFENPALMLMTNVVEGKMVMAYPWHISMDLGVGVLSIDRSRPLDEQAQAYESIKAIFQDLFKSEVSNERLAELLNLLLSGDIEVSIAAARQLALPPAQKVNLGSIEELNRIMMEVADNA